MLSTRISIIAASIGYALAHGRVTSPAARVVSVNPDQCNEVFHYLFIGWGWDGSKVWDPSV